MQGANTHVHYFGLFLEGVKKMAKNLSKNNRSPEEIRTLHLHGVPVALLLGEPSLFCCVAEKGGEKSKRPDFTNWFLVDL
jgi:hypothetical protein